MATRKIRYLGQPEFKLNPVKHPNTVKAEVLRTKPYGELTFDEKKFLEDCDRNPRPVSYVREYIYSRKDGEIQRDFPKDAEGNLAPKVVLSKYKFMPPDYIGTVSEADSAILDGNDFGTTFPLYAAADEVFIAPPKPTDEAWMKEKEELLSQMAGMKNEIQGMKMRLGKGQKPKDEAVA